MNYYLDYRKECFVEPDQVSIFRRKAYFTSLIHPAREGMTMFSFDYGLPAAIVIALILFSWFSFFSVVFA